MGNKRMKVSAGILALQWVTVFCLFGQEVQKFDPIFPQLNSELVFVEGEGAVSTNFAPEPIFNYSCSNSLSLQLSRESLLQGGSPYYAEYAFYVENTGEYELWYGGTPPGPREEFSPSYSSPFAYQIDDGVPVSTYREDVIVVEQYTPSYYWSILGDVELQTGAHSIRFEVTEKREHDGRYFFYLDCFFLVRKEDGKRLVHEPLPQVFPMDMADRSIDYPFRSIEDYEIITRENPDNVAAYIDLSLVFSLLGDNLNALKYIKRAILLNPEDRELKLIQAKNLIWKGDMDEGLEEYRKLLVEDPGKLDLWMEAGKVSAWSRRYEDSIAFFEDGLNVFPDNLDLMVNMGLTYSWSGELGKGERVLDQAKSVAGEDYEKLLNLGKIFQLNDDPEKAAKLYEEIIQRFPQYLEPYLLLETIHFDAAKEARAADVHSEILATFNPSDRLDSALQIFAERQAMKEQIIENYEAALAEYPDDLALREVLAQTYFWNRWKELGIQEYFNIIVNYAYTGLEGMVTNSQEVFSLLDRNYGYLYYVSRVDSVFADQKTALLGALAKFKNAQTNYQKFLEDSSSTKEGEDPQAEFKNMENDLATQVVITRDLLNAYRLIHDEYIADSEKIATFIAEEKNDADTFARITEINRWSWDRKGFIQELQGVKSSAEPLAQHILGRIYFAEGDPVTAQRILGGIQKNAVQQYALFQALLGMGDVENALSLTDEFIPSSATALLPLLVTALQREAKGAFVLGVSEDQVSQLIEEINQEQKSTQDLKEQISNDLRDVHSIIQNKMIRSFFHFEENTLLIRRELGDFYLAEEEVDEAIRQYQRVLAIDGWDVGTMFRLGDLYAQNGDWYEGMNKYERVYYSDPLYENVAHHYNALARQNADTLSLNSYFMTDPTKLLFNNRATWSMSFNSLLGIDIMYTGEHTRTFAGVTHTSYSFQNIYAGLPVDLYWMGLKIKPLAGISLSSTIYNEEVAAQMTVDPDLPDEYYTPRFFDVVRTISVNPLLGIGVTKSIGSNFSLYGGYRFGRHEETFNPSGESVLKHEGEVVGELRWGFLDAYPFRDSTTRTYGKIGFLSDNNILWQALQELTLGIVRLDEPLFSLNLFGSALYEDSLNTDSTNYYAPEEIFVAGGGLSGSVWIDINDDNSLGISARMSGASFIEKFLTPEDRLKRFQLELEGIVQLSRGEASYYLGSAFSRTFSKQSDDYWSLYFLLGGTLRTPKLLVP